MQSKGVLMVWFWLLALTWVSELGLSQQPSTAPSTTQPSRSPSSAPSTSAPSKSPSAAPSRAPTTSKPSKSPSRTPTTSNPTKAPSFPTKVPSRAPSSQPTSSPIALSRVVTLPSVIKSSVVVKSQQTERLDISYNVAEARGEPVSITLRNTLDPVISLKYQGTTTMVKDVTQAPMTANAFISILVDVSGLSASIAAKSVALNLEFKLTNRPNTPILANVTVTVDITVLTAIVFPDSISYSIPFGTLQNKTTLNPAPVIQVFNALCNSSITYTIQPGGVCPQVEGVFPATQVPWLDFENPALLTGGTSTIAGGRGLPDSLNFDLDFRNIQRSPGVDRAETYQTCLTFLVELGAFGVSIQKTVFISVTTIKPCPAGSSSSTGDDTNGCPPCPLGTFQPRTFSTACLSCPESFPNTLQTGAISEAQCVTASNFVNVKGSRLNCPIGANCTSPGLTVETLPVNPGFWRSSPESLEIRKCTREKYCVGGTFKVSSTTITNGRRILQETPLSNGSDLCRQYHEGVLCSKCVDGTIKRTADKFCAVCDNDSLVSDQARMAGILFGLLCIIIFFMSMFCWHSKYQLETRGNESLGLVAPEAEKGEIQTANPQFEGDHGPHHKEIQSNFVLRFLDTVDITVQFKIIIGLFQVIGGMSIAFEDALPEFFRNISSFLAILSFDVITVFDFGCALRDQSHYATLLVSTLFPVGLICIVLGMDRVLRKTKFKDRPDMLKEMDIINYTIVLLILFLVYPSVSSVILKTYDCRSFGDIVVLGSDLATECYTERYHAYLIYAAVCTVVFVAGIPIYYAVLLYREREKINLDPTGFVNDRELVRFRDGQESIAYLRFLWKPYRPFAYWFEVYELLRKLGQTSILVYVAPGTSIQMCFQLAITAFSVVVLHVFRPYQRLGNQVLALISQWVIFMITFISLLIKVEAIVAAVRSQVSIDVPESYDTNLLNAILFVLLVIAPIVAVIDIFNQLLENELYRRIWACMTCCCPRRFLKLRNYRPISRWNNGPSSRSTAGAHGEQNPAAPASFVSLVTMHSSHELARRADVALKIRDDELSELREKQKEAQKAIEDLHLKVAELEALAERRRSVAPSESNAGISALRLLGTSFRTAVTGTSFKSKVPNQ